MYKVKKSLYKKRRPRFQVRLSDVGIHPPA